MSPTPPPQPPASPHTATPGAIGRRVLAIDGIDGSGKSVLARRVAQAAAAAGLQTVSLAVDDFRRPVAWGGGDACAEADAYYRDYYDLVLLDRCLAAFLAGAPSVEIPIFDAAQNRLDGWRRIDFPADRALAIVEGVFALRVATLAASAAVIYLRTTFGAAQRRVRARDTGRGRTPEDVDHRIARRYFPGHQRYLREIDPLKRADVIIDHEELGAPRLVRFDAQTIGARLGSPGAPGPDLAEVLRAALQAFATPAEVG